MMVLTIIMNVMTKITMIIMKSVMKMKMKMKMTIKNKMKMMKMKVKMSMMMMKKVSDDDGYLVMKLSCNEIYLEMKFI